MKAYNPERPLASLHIPKTAGTSFREILGEWFGPRLRFHYAGRDGPPETQVLPPGGCVHGHFNRLRGIGVTDYYPEIDQFIVFVREPFARAVSQWRYLQHQRRSGWALPELEGIDSFDDWISLRRDRYPEPLDPYAMPAQLPETTARDPLEQLRGFIGVGVTEHYEASVRRLALALGRPEPGPAPWLNRAPLALEVPASRADYERRSPSEYALYEAALRLLRE